MKSKYFSLSILSTVLLCVPLTALMAAPAPKPPSLDTRVATLEAKVAALELLLADVSRITDPNTGQDTLRFSAMNVQVVNGLSSTATTNGSGNLIVGYNEPFGPNDLCPDDRYCNRRGGSHNLVIGNSDNYSSYGGMVVGAVNETSGPYSSVSGGNANIASGWYSSVSGGSNGLASNYASSVSGGSSNTASNEYASVSGGQGNIASGRLSSVSGGEGNEASEAGTSVSGGIYNIASGGQSSVSGGYQNVASGFYSSVSGGDTKTASTESCTVGDNYTNC